MAPHTKLYPKEVNNRVSKINHAKIWVLKSQIKITKKHYEKKFRNK